jgi:hypothetical protein
MRMEFPVMISAQGSRERRDPVPRNAVKAGGQ